MRNSCIYKITGTKTFRLSSSAILPKKVEINGKMKKKGWGSNLQNIEKSLRQIYIPDPGKIFVQVDQSGAEALIVAYCCRDGNYRQLFKNNIKPHSYLAMHLFPHIWPEKMKEIGAGQDFNIDELIATPIKKLNDNPQWRQLGKLIKASDDWSLRERYYYLAKQTEHSCVDEVTLVLTRQGWKAVGDVAKTGILTEEIAVYDKQGNITFEVPKVWNSMSITGTMYEFIGEEVNQFVTGNHRVIYQSNGTLHERIASDAFRLNRLNIPTSGSYIGGSYNLPDWKVKLLVAIQADGHWCMSEAEGATEHLPKVIFRLKKERKIKRLLTLLKESGNRYTYKVHENDVHCITVFDLEDTVKYFNNVKVWGNWLLNFSKSNLELLINELKYWDGTFEESSLHKREAYFTAIKENAKWIKLICHLTDKQGTRNKTQAGMYTVGINNRKFSIINSSCAKKNWSGMVYCPTVSTGMFVINRMGKISITGNSNYDIQPPTFRLNILEKSGGKIVISKEDSERFIATKHGLYPEIKEDCHTWIRRCVNETSTLYNLHGHPYQITAHEIRESDWKELYAWVFQSTVGEITNIAYNNLQAYIEENKLAWDLLANSHDAYLCQCSIAEKIQCAKVMQQFINQEFTSPFDGVKFSMKSEAVAGFNWYNFHKEKNPLGLKEINYDE